MVSVSRITTGSVTVTDSVAAGTKQTVVESDFDASQVQVSLQVFASRQRMRYQ